jgi:hypothetical protein
MMNPLENILGAALVGGTLVFSPLLRGRYNRWGASEAEVQQAMPGDELVPRPLSGYTRAITIQAPPEKVWPWLVQLGQGRAGMYSYDGLENLARCDIHTIERILPECQELKPGDVIRMGPKGYPCFGVERVEPPCVLVLAGLNPQTEQPPAPDADTTQAYSNGTWQFLLEAQGKDVTRLLVRQRLDYSLDMAMVWRLTEPVAFVMERKMLLTLRRLAEKR